MRRNRLILLSLGLIVLASLAGGLLGVRVLALSSQNSAALELFSEIVEKVEDNYAVEVDRKELIYGAIYGMLETLDPHTNFLPSEMFNAIREEQAGKFYGLGIVVSMREDRLTVISPIEGTPAYRLGITAGDVIARINGESTEEMSINEAVSRLRGPKGTPVDISISRPGFDELFDFTIVRDEVPTHSVTASYIIQPGTGYIRLKNFTQTSAEEMEANLADLRAQGMERLLLDLRNNSGGLLDQAVLLGDIFLPDRQLIVSTHGRIPSSDQEFYTTEEDRHDFFEEMPLVVLTNRGSASASEIIAGTVQDHDRGLVVGEPTWGKGLVQSVYPLSYETGLALTTARYFTPSGRCIQRDNEALDDFIPDEGEEVDAEDTPQRAPGAPEGTAPANSPGQAPGDAEGAAPEGAPEQSPAGIEGARPAAPASAEVFHTATGRPVTGGGGVTPDVIVRQRRRSEFVQGLYLRSIFFHFGVRYLAEHGEGVDKGFRVDEEVLRLFRAFLEERKIPCTEEELAAGREEIARQIRLEVLTSRYGMEEGFQASLEDDPQIARAMELFADSARLADSARQQRRLRESEPDEARKVAAAERLGSDSALR